MSQGGQQLGRGDRCLRGKYLVKAGVALGGLLPRHVPETVVLGLGIVVGAVVKGWGAEERSATVAGGHADMRKQRSSRDIHRSPIWVM